MRTIELAGSVGAGKTSLVEPLRSILADESHEVLTLSEARKRVAPHGFGWPAGLAGAVRFTARHPGLVVHAARSLLGAPIPGWHRRHIFMLVMRLGSELDMIEAKLSPEASVILDEGWLHRSVNLFAWRVPIPALEEIARYLDRAPLSRTIVLVDAPKAILRDRLASRGLPKRLRDRPDAEADAFLARAERVLGLAASSLAEDPRGVRLLRVTNDGSPEDLSRRLAGGLTSGIAAVRPWRHVQAWPSLPRPDRLVGRNVARLRATPLSADLVRAASRGFGLPDPVVAEPSPAPGGRGTVLTLRDGDGERWLLKRYKASLADDDIAVEHAVLQRLTQIGFRAPRLKGDDAGLTMLRANGARLALFEMVSGH
ncbi:MAG: hypothetical protein WKH68_05690, partial [Candidatus Limnocylindria bacterium]